MPRLFTGIEIPENIREEITRLQSGIDGARWIEPGDFHITLRFVGNIDNRQAEEFSSFISQIQFKPIEISLTGTGSFGGRKPRAVWIGIKPCKALVNLHHTHEMAAQYAGLKPESRKFIPHVTLARLRNISPAVTARYLESINFVSLPPFKITRTALFSARPGGGGGPYHVETTHPATEITPRDQRQEIS